jgi:hypothetical protein
MVRFRTTERPISKGDPLAQIYMPLDKAVKNMSYIIISFQEKYALNPVKNAVYKKLASDFANFNNGIYLLKKSLEPPESTVAHNASKAAKIPLVFILSAARDKGAGVEANNLKTKEEIEALKAIANSLKERSSQVIEARNMLQKFGVYQDINNVQIMKKFTEVAELLYKSSQAAEINLKNINRP